ncbi:hypothetical protein [Prochlorococcus marinus]|uniref:hypothetical protein n=1 Tax=Prochlorococcus marinus TaxID=1219 RepID=UPI0039B06774
MKTNKVCMECKNFINALLMSKNNLYIPLKVVPYIFISITAIAITAATYVIT